MFELKNHETLVVDRRRRKENQTQAAKRWGISQPVYSLWERNKHNHVPRTELYSGELITKTEVCFIKRRREKMTQAQLAKRMNYSEEWVKRMERGMVNGQPLFDFWGI